MEIPNKNTGVIKPVLKETDYIQGAQTGIIYKVVNPSGNWGDSLPAHELQYRQAVDSRACVTFSALHDLATQIDYFISNKLISDYSINKLKEWGYLDENGKFNASDRFIAKLSGTTQQGNSNVNVWDSIREPENKDVDVNANRAAHTGALAYGLVPESMWQFTPGMTFEEYYADIPQNVIDFGKNFLTLFKIQYEWVATGAINQTPIDAMKVALKQAPLQIDIPWCSGWQTEPIVQPCGKTSTDHATEVYNISDTAVEILDQYEPTLKKLALNYCIPYVLKGVITEKPQVEQIIQTTNDIIQNQVPKLDKKDQLVVLQPLINLLKSLVSFFQSKKK